MCLNNIVFEFTFFLINRISSYMYSSRTWQFLTLENQHPSTWILFSYSVFISLLCSIPWCTYTPIYPFSFGGTYYKHYSVYSKIVYVLRPFISFPSHKIFILHVHSCDLFLSLMRPCEHIPILVSKPLWYKLKRLHSIPPYIYNIILFTHPSCWASQLLRIFMLW